MHYAWQRLEQRIMPGMQITSVTQVSVEFQGDELEADASCSAFRLPGSVPQCSETIGDEKRWTTKLPFAQGNAKCARPV